MNVSDEDYEAMHADLAPAGLEYTPEELAAMEAEFRAWQERFAEQERIVADYWAERLARGLDAVPF